MACFVPMLLLSAGLAFLAHAQSAKSQRAALPTTAVKPDSSGKPVVEHFVTALDPFWSRLSDAGIDLVLEYLGEVRRSSAAAIAKETPMPVS